MNINRTIVAAKRICTIAILCCLLLGLGFRPAATQETVWAAEHPGVLSVTLSTDQANYRLGSRILVTIRQENVSSATVITSLLGASTDYDLVISHDSTRNEVCTFGRKAWSVRHGPD